MHTAGAELGNEVNAELARLDLQLRRIDIAGIHASHRNAILPHYPNGIRLALTQKYLDTATPERQVLLGEERRKAIAEGRGADSWAQANIDLARDHARIKACRGHLAWSHGTIRDMARQCAEICSVVSRARDPQSAYRAVGFIAEHHRIRMPQPDRGKTLAGCVARLCDSKWWRRAIRSTYARYSEDMERELGLVSQKKGLYASDDSVARRREQKVRNRDMLSEMVAVNDLGECFRLSELSDVNVSNPRIRRAELMTRIAGFERYAKAAGHSAYFLTLTLPSRFHCILKKSGTRNRRFDGGTVAEGHKFLCKQWAKLRSHLARKGIHIYGFRIAEPHHDGTPHWHLIVFVEMTGAAAALAAFQSYFDPPEEAEPGSAHRRVEVVPIDEKKGSAAGYVAKYVSKNIDGFGVGDDAEADPMASEATETAKRVDAWASAHGIRQFQQIGGPPVSVWRELRRIRTPSAGVIERARLAAEDQSWEQYCEVMGGMHCRAGDRPVQLHAVRSSKPGLYGDPIDRQIKGVSAGAVIVVTRVRSWTFVRAPNSESPWTRVNNCTVALQRASADAPSPAQMVPQPHRSRRPADARERVHPFPRAPDTAPLAV